MNRMLAPFFRLVKDARALLHPTDHDYDEMLRLIAWYDNPIASPATLIFGDSVVERVSRDDDDQRTLGQMLVDRLAGETNAVYLSHSAYHPEVHYYLLRAIVTRMRARPKVLVVPVNLRCFSPQWMYEPQWQFLEEIDVLKRFIDGQPLGRVRDIRNLEERRRHAHARSVQYPLSELRRVEDFKAVIAVQPDVPDFAFERKRTIFIFHYLHSLTSENPRLRSLVQLTALAQDVGIRLYLYSTPINFQAGERYVGKGFSDTLMEQTALIKASVSQYPVTFDDFTLALSSAYFFDADLATEHLNQSGRLWLSDQVASHVVSAAIDITG